MHRVQAGPARRRSGSTRSRTCASPARSTRVGTLARASVERPFEEKRFDLVVELDRDRRRAAAGDDRARRHPGRRADQDVLLVPINAVFDRAGRAGRPRACGRSASRRGRSSWANPTTRKVEVVAGLDEGERVALTDVRRQPARGRGAGRPRGKSDAALPPLTREAALRALAGAGARVTSAELLAISAEALGRYKLRTALSVLGVVLGVAAVIAMMSVSEGARARSPRPGGAAGPRQPGGRATRAGRAASAQADRPPGLTAGDARALPMLVPLARPRCAAASSAT